MLWTSQALKWFALLLAGTKREREGGLSKPKKKGMQPWCRRMRAERRAPSPGDHALSWHGNLLAQHAKTEQHPCNPPGSPVETAFRNKGNWVPHTRADSRIAIAEYFGIVAPRNFTVLITPQPSLGIEEVIFLLQGMAASDKYMMMLMSTLVWTV